MSRRDPIQHDHEHRNMIRSIHGRPERDLCPKCSTPVVFERNIQECGGRTVRECPRSRCSWDDFEEQRLAWIASLDEDPGFSEL